MKQWKRGASLLLALCLMLNQCMLTAFADPPSVSLSYTATVTDDYTAGDGIKTVHRGDTVEFSLRIDETDTNAYRGVYTVISFDPSALSYVENSLEPGPEGAAEKFALVSAGDDLTTSGTLRFAAVHSEDQTSGTVYAKFTLKVTDTAAVGVYPITIARADVTSYDDVTFDADGNLHGTNAGMDLAAITATKVNDAVRIVAPAELTPPTANDLTYNRAEQTLVSGGSATHGTLKYYVSDAILTDEQIAAISDWSETAPQKTNAGTYYVYYKAFGDAGYEDSTVGSVPVTIKPKDISAATVTLSSTSQTYDGTSKEVSVDSVALEAFGLTADTEYTVKAGSTLNAIAVGSYTVTVQGVGNYTGEASAMWNISSIGVTVAGYEGVYDGASHSPTAEAKPGVEGVTFTYSTDDGATWTETAPTITDVGTVAVKVKATKEGAAPEEYDVTLKVKPKAVTVTADDKSKTYGEADPAFTATVSGTLGSDTVTYSISRAVGENAGNYTVTPTGDATQGNYDVTYVSGTLTVNQRPLTFTWSTPTTFTYDGGVKTVTATANTVSGDMLTLTYTDNSKANVGDYTAKVAGVSGEKSGNYAFSTTETTASCDWSITKASNTATVSISNWTYGDAANAPTTTADYGADTATYLYKVKGADDSTYSATVPTQAGDYTVKATIAAGSNYDGVSATADFTIEQREVTISGITASNKTYDGSTAATLNCDNAVFAGKLAGDTLTVTATGAFDTADAGDGKTVTISGLTLGGADAGNYKLAASGQQTTTAADVTQKEIGLSWSTDTLTYNGSAQAPTATATGLVSGDEIGVVVSGVETNVGTGYTATATGLTGEKAGNYKLPAANTQSFSISKAVLTVKANDKTITYGDAPAHNGVTYSGFVGSDTVDSVVSGSVTYTYDYTQYGDVGNYTITPDVTGLSADNYSFAPANGTLTVGQKEITLNWSTDPLTYNGSAQTPTATASGTVNGDVIGVTVSGGQTNAGTGYTATASGLTGEKAGNYKLPAVKTHTFDIAKATLTVTADNKTATYGDAAPTYTVSYSGWKGSDSAASLTTAPTANSAYAQWSNVGNYPITPSGGTATNYSFSYVNGTLTVNPKNISGATITLADETLNDDGTLKTRTVSSVVVDGRTLTSGTDYTVSGNTGTAQGDYTLTITGTGNYTGTATKPWSIGPKAGALLSTIEGYSGVYDAGSHSLTVVKAYDDVTLTYSTNGGASWTSTAPSITNVGTTTVTVRATRGTTDEDYVRTLTVTAKAVTVTADDKSKSYGAADPALTATVNGTIGSDTVSYSISRAAGDAAGDYAITPSGAAAQGNYTVNYVPGTLTITQAAANTVTVSITGWTYGAYDATTNGPTATATFGAATATYTYYTDSACTTPTTAANSGAAADGARPENAGTYYVKATVAGTADYAAGTSPAQSFTIGKAPITPVVTLANWLVGSAPNSPSLTPGSNPGGGTVTYTYYTDAACTQKTTEADHGADSEGAVPAFGGTYYVKATVAETANYQAGSAVKEFKIELFQVVFVDYNGTELKRTGYGTGQTLTALDVPADPTRAPENELDETNTVIGTTTFAFNGWSPAVDFVNEITGHRVYTATYTGTYAPKDGSPGYSETVTGVSTINVTQEVDANGDVKVTTTTATTTTTQKTVGVETETTEIIYSVTTTVKTTDSAGATVSSTTANRIARIVAKVDEKALTVPVVDDTTYVTGTPDTSAAQTTVTTQTNTTAGAVNSVTLDDVTAAALLMKAVGDYPASTNLLGEVYLQSTLTGYTLATEESGITAVKLIYVVKPFLRVTDLSTPASPVVKENTELKNTDLPTAPPPQITFRLPIPNIFSDLDFVEVEHVSGDLVAYPTPEVTREPIRLDATSGQYYVELTVSHFSKFTLTPSYTITYNLAGGAAANPGSYTISSATFTLNNPTRGGYTFDGWTGTGLAAATTTVTIPTGSVGDRAYTATWTYAGGGGGGGGGATPPKKDDKDTGGPVSPSVSGVDRLLNTDDHILFIRGYVDGSVQPEGNITRAETAMMLYRLLRNQNVAITQDFSDVADGAWYAEAVRKLASMGVILGYEDGTFLPDKAITRAEFTAMAARFAYATEGKMYFTDVGDGFWAYQQIIAASTYGWINGYEDETFRPQNAITRAEAAAVLNRMLGRKADMPYAMAHEDELVYFFDLRKDKWYYADMVEATNGHDHEGENSTEVWKKIRH